MEHWQASAELRFSQNWMPTMDFGKFLCLHHHASSLLSLGRYCFNKLLPFGISSAPEHFQHRMSEILANLPGVVCQMDDILVFGKTHREHDNYLEVVLRWIEEANVTLSPQKCEFSKTKLTFLGHVIDTVGIRADPEKTKAIVDMSPPTSVSELRRFLGMTNQLGKFTPNLAQTTQPLRELLSKSRNWTWAPSQSKAFDQVKEELSKPTTLAMLHHMAWEQYYSRKQMACGDLLPLHPVQCQKQKDDTHSSRRKPLLQLGHVRNFLILF